MPDKNSIHQTQKLFAAFLFGLNIPGARFVSGEQVQNMLSPLSPRIAFVRIVARPDSVLLRCDASITEQSLREALSIHLGCNSVVIDTESLCRVITAAQNALKSIEPIEVEWEWCLVLCSEQLPSSLIEKRGLFPHTTKVVPVCILESRALLVRKRRLNPSGTRIMTGTILIKPWEGALKRNGIVPNCLTSRTLNQVERVARASGKREVIEALEQSSGKYESKLPSELFEQVTDILAEILVLDYQKHHPIDSMHSKKNGSADTKN